MHPLLPAHLSTSVVPPGLSHPPIHLSTYSFASLYEAHLPIFRKSASSLTWPSFHLCCSTSNGLPGLPSTPPPAPTSHSTSSHFNRTSHSFLTYPIHYTYLVPHPPVMIHLPSHPLISLTCIISHSFPSVLPPFRKTPLIHPHQGNIYGKDNAKENYDGKKRRQKK